MPSVGRTKVLRYIDSIAESYSVFKYASSAPTREPRVAIRSPSDRQPDRGRSCPGTGSAPKVCPVLALPGTAVSYSLIRIVSLETVSGRRPVRPFEADERFVVVQVAAEESSRARRRAHQLAQRGNRSVVQVRRLRPDAVQHVRLVAVGALRHAPGRVAEVLVESRLPVALRHAPVGARLPLVVQAVDAAGFHHERGQSEARHAGVHHRAIRIHAKLRGRVDRLVARTCGTWRSSALNSALPSRARARSTLPNGYGGGGRLSMNGLSGS